MSQARGVTALLGANLHNVSEQVIFRPSALNGFGTADLEGADYWVFANLGSVYT